MVCDSFFLKTKNNHVLFVNDIFRLRRTNQLTMGIEQIATGLSLKHLTLYCTTADVLKQILPLVPQLREFVVGIVSNDTINYDGNDGTILSDAATVIDTLLRHNHQLRYVAIASIFNMISFIPPRDDTKQFSAVQPDKQKYKRTLRPFYVHQWLDVCDCLGEWFGF